MSMSGRGGGDTQYIGLDSTTLFHWSWAGVCRTRALRPPMGAGKSYPQQVQNAFTHVKKRISEGIEPLTSSSGVPTFCEVQATARLTHSPTNLYPLMDKCTKSLERIAPCTIHSSLLQMSSGVRTMLDSMHFIRDMNTPSLKISLRNKL